MRKTLLGMYHQLKESGSTSDFPYLLGNTMYKILIDKFKGVASPWKQYTAQGDLADFKTHDRVIVGEAPDLVELEEDGEYQDSKLTDYRYQIALTTKGRTFKIGRQVIINDDLDAIKKQPARFGRAAARTLAKRVVAALESDGLAYDGTRLFQDARNSTDVTLANTAAGLAGVLAAMTGIRVATEPSTSEKMGLQPKYLLVNPYLEDIANQLCRGSQVWPVSTNGGSPTNPLTGLTPLIEPFLTSQTSWYVLADPQDAPAVEVGFLNGKEEPDLLMMKANAVNLAGGEDEFGYDFDEIFYKVRHDYAVARAMWQGIFRGKR